MARLRASLVDPNGILATMVAMYQGDPTNSMPARRGQAVVEFAIPALPWVLSTQMTTQWFDLGQAVSSNGIT